MICKNCGFENAENSKFCSGCGSELTVAENNKASFCAACGASLKGNENFCGKCGNPLKSLEESEAEIKEKTKPSDMSEEAKKAKKSYVWSILSAVITFILRLFLDERIHSVDIWSGYWYRGIDENLKPMLTSIPGIAAVIVLYIIFTNKKLDSTGKSALLIKNGIFIALSILFIWFNIPESLYDF